MPSRPLLRIQRTLIAGWTSLAIGLALVHLALWGCAYRLAPPPRLDEGLSISIAVNDLRLVRFQTCLQGAVARRLSDRLGWQATPRGPATLALSLQREKINTVGSGPEHLPNQWQFRFRGNYELRTSQHGPVAGTFTGQGFAADRMSEPAAIEQAANQAADALVSDLEQRCRGW